MTCYSTANSIASRIVEYNSNPIYKSATNLITLPVRPIGIALDLIKSIGVSFSALISLGTDNRYYRIAMEDLNNVNRLISSPYRNLIYVLNPSGYIYPNGKPIIYDACVGPIFDKAAKYASHGNPFVEHVVSRLAFALMAVACVVSRVADFALGIFAAALSILCLGRVQKLNEISYSELKITGVINDLFFCAIKILNPSAEIGSDDLPDLS